MKIKKKILSLALAGTMALGLMPGMTMTALADGDTSYTLVIPSTLTVANSGWTATTGISATGTLESGKKLSVTAASTNSWALKQQDGNETVSYTMKETSDGVAKTAWEFTTLPGSATLGIDVADYSTKPAGTYTDTVTFTASVEDAVTTPTVGTVFPIGTADLGDYYYWNHEIGADELRMKFKNFGTATISVEDNYSHPSLGNYRVISINSPTAQAIDWEMTQMDPTGPWAEWSNMPSYNYFKVDNYDTTPTGIRIASGSGTEEDPFTFELVFD